MRIQILFNPIKDFPLATMHRLLQVLIFPTIYDLIILFLFFSKTFTTPLNQSTHYLPRRLTEKDLPLIDSILPKP